MARMLDPVISGMPPPPRDGRSLRPGRSVVKRLGRARSHGLPTSGEAPERSLAVREGKGEFGPGRSLRTGKKSDRPNAPPTQEKHKVSARRARR
jgi:hypothetical protein